MTFIKKCSLFLFILLLITSIYKDVTIGSPNPYYNYHNKTQENIPHQIIKVKVQQGETVLSIVEKINSKENKPLNIQAIMGDFLKANPNTDPYQLKPNTFYYFPLYKKE